MNAELWKGMFIGGLIVLLMILIIISASNRKSSRIANSANSRNEALLRDRNEIGQLQVHHLSQIQCVLTRNAQDKAVDWLTRKHREKADRRERIATAFMAAEITVDNTAADERLASRAIASADALIEALDRRNDPPVTPTILEND